MMDIKKVGYVAMMLSVLAMPVLSLAAVALLPEPTSPIEASAGYDLNKIQTIIETIAKFLIVVGVVIAVIVIIWGGITYMAAGGDETKAGVAKDRIKNGVIGAAVVLGVGVILQTVAKLVTGTFFG